MPKNPPDGYHTITPYAIVEDPASTIDFLTGVLEGELTEKMLDGERIMHAEVKVGDSIIMLGGSNDDFPPAPMMGYVYIADVDAVYQAAIDAGARSVQEPEDQFYGDRTAGVVDGQGNTWWLSTRIEDLSSAEMQRRAASR